jgi:hypothetical protein
MIERDNYTNREGRKTERQGEKQYYKEKEKRHFACSPCSVHSKRFSRAGPSQLKLVLAIDVLIITQAFILVL